jgi:predicted amidophosphoribosyltransferase
MAPAPAHRCAVCSRALSVAGTPCPNPLCRSASRWFRWNLAVAERSGPLEVALNDYKFGGDRSWAPVFGRMVAGYLVREERLVAGFDLVVASPTFVGPGGRDFDHIRSILLAAAGSLPPAGDGTIDTAPVPAVIRTGPVPRLTGNGYQMRRRIAAECLRPVLRVTDPKRVSRRRVLVFDDVFTDGSTLNEVARTLRLAGGAREVCGLSLCRQPWRGAGGATAASRGRPAA